jgi:hypothetical protein
VQILDDASYIRGPIEFMGKLDALLTRGMIMSRYGMLEWAANYEMKYDPKTCKDCKIIDDENHQINYCKKWEATRLFGSDEKVDFEMVYSTDMKECILIVERVLLMWYLSNGKNWMR